MELKHGSISQREPSTQKTRWSKFKDAVKKHPETTAYAATFIASTAVTFSNFPTSIPTGAAGVSLFSMMAGTFAFIREEFLKKSFTKADRIATSVVANVGFIASAVIMQTKHSMAGAVLGSASILASVLYKPVKEIINHATATVKQKIQLLSCGAAVMSGILAATVGLSSGGYHGLFNINLKVWQMAAVDFGAAAIGVTVAILAGMKFMKTADDIKPEANTTNSI
ncbi:hypothetical protein L0Y65_01525 [Candidatus Micrarchaeota archaeon]|nr:hypothetical protein [Candidatus Micrarchaeota archaeon]